MQECPGSSAQRSIFCLPVKMAPLRLQPNALMQAAQFTTTQDHQHKVQLFFSIMLTLLEHQLLDLKERSTPAALATDPTLDVEAKFDRIAAAIKVGFLYAVRLCCLSAGDFGPVGQGFFLGSRFL